MSATTNPDTLAVARWYLARGWAPIPIPHATKFPPYPGWQHLILAADELPRHFTHQPQNVGILLGEPSGGLIDVDLDSAEGRTLAGRFLPDTGCMFGRASAPASHWLYIVHEAIRREQWRDPLRPRDDERSLLVEVRGTGHQTVFPPSTHPSGERISWLRREVPAAVSLAALRAQVGVLAAACVLARYWPGTGSRQDATLALGGGLLHAGWPEERATDFVAAVAAAAGDEEHLKRAESVRYTARAANQGRQTTGWPVLAALVGDMVVDTVREWLGLREVEDTAPTRKRHAPEDGPESAPPAVEPFPDHILPPAVRAYCVSAAQSLGAEVPVAIVAAPLVAFTGALAGNRVYLAVKDSWAERGGLTVAIIGKPGTIKSPALRHAKWPIKSLQDDAYSIFEQAMARYKTDYAAWKKDQSGDEPERPRLREYFAADVTMEALAEMLGRNPGICIIVDELRGWVLGFDKYRAKGGNDRQQALSLWGSETIKVNRKTGDPLYVSAPVASVAGGLQPDYADAFHTGKNATDGSTERVLPVVCDHGSQRWTPATIAPETYHEIAELFRQLDRLPAGDRQPHKPVGIAVRLSSEAERLWIDFYDENSQRVNAASGLEAGMLQKLSTHTARFALNLHLLWHADDPRVMVTEQTMASAIELSDWWRGHINRYLWLLGKQAANPAESPLATRILRVLRKDRDPDRAGWVRRSELYHELGNVAAEDLSDSLAALLREERIERREERTATKPVEWWRIVPERSHYSHYSCDRAAAEPDHRENANTANSPPAEPTPLFDDAEWEEWAV